jgi:uncharacterized protein (DUF362 family)
MDRRDFVKHAAVVAAAATAIGAIGCGKDKSTAQSPGDSAPSVPSTKSPSATPPASGAGKVGSNRHDPKAGAANVIVAKGTDAAVMLAAAMKAIGGADLFIHKGDVVVIKPNLAWGRTPEQAANTSPAVLAAVIKMAQAAGPKEVLVVEHSCDESSVSFEMSGAAKVCKDLGVRLVSLNNESMYKEVALPQGITLKSEMLPLDLLDCDCYINLPCSKVHSASVVTFGLKNQMGVVWDRQRYHQSKSEAQKGGNLHQNIADVATGMRPTLTIIDGLNSLVIGGPKGPGKVVATNKLIVSADMVAADAVAAPLVGSKPELVDHIRIAGEMGVGIADPSKLKIANV